MVELGKILTYQRREGGTGDEGKHLPSLFISIRLHGIYLHPLRRIPKMLGVVEKQNFWRKLLVALGKNIYKREGVGREGGELMFSHF